jgi:hypothetical protein
MKPGLAVGAAAGFALIAPFRMSPLGAFDFYLEASGTYEVTSVFAFNLWGALGFWQADVGPGAVRFLGLPAVVWGLSAFVLGGAVLLARAWKALRDGEDEGRVLFVGSASIVLLGFAVLTRIHERYLFLALGLLVVFVTVRGLRLLVLVLSGSYLANLVLPYTYYLGVEHRGSSLDGLANLLFGSDAFGPRVRAISLAVGLLCIAMAWYVWKALDRARSMPSDHVALSADPDDETRERRPWSLKLHPVGRRGALLAVGVFGVALVMKLAGLGHPPGMYFDEVYHARAGAEYLAGKDVFEWTHPPLAKQLIGVGIHRFSGFEARAGSSFDADLQRGSLGPTDDGAAWVRGSGGSLHAQLGVVDASCDLEPRHVVPVDDLTPVSLTGVGGATYLAGEGGDGPELVRVTEERESWRVSLPAPAAQTVVTDTRVWVVTNQGDLLGVSPEGEAALVASGVASVSSPGRDNTILASFPREGRVSSWGTDGQEQQEVEVPGASGPIAVHGGSNRLFVATNDAIAVIDAERAIVDELLPGGADYLEVVPETTVVWAVDGRDTRAVEPHSGAVMGQVSFEQRPQAVFSDPVRHRLVAVGEESLECASGRPQLAWRLGSAMAGAGMAALALLLGIRLFGGVAIGLLASLFLATDGLAFTLSRYATIDSYVAAFVLAALFCALSALYARDKYFEGKPSSPSARPWVVLAWLGGVGVFGGLGLASKWVALYGLVAIGLLLLWDASLRGPRSVWRIAGGVVPSTAVLALLGVVVPLAIYVLTYVPFLQLGNGFRDLISLQDRMYGYHSGLEAGHPFGSPWYGWPFGYRAVFLYLAGGGGERAEMWTIPNLVVFLGGLAAMVVVGRAAWRARSVALAVVVGAALVQYLPWTVVGRVIFLYHYLPVVPFLALALAWVLVRGLRGWRYQRHLTLATVAAAVGFFLFVLPALVGWSMPDAYHDLLRRALPWVI